MRILPPLPNLLATFLCNMSIMMCIIVESLHFQFTVYHPRLQYIKVHKLHERVIVFKMAITLSEPQF